jgi:cyclopropane-fatty-acyl-phospholipid synthase
VEGNFVVEDWHGFGADYDRTLMEWHQRFDQHWSELESHYGVRFKRMWNFWLLASAAYFRARRDQLWQVVLSPHGVPGGYREVR